MATIRLSRSMPCATWSNAAPTSTRMHDDWQPRYDKTGDSFLGFVHIVSIRLWTRQFVNAS